MSSKPDILYDVIIRLRQAIKLMEKSKGAFQSKLIADARVAVEDAVKILENLKEI